MNERFETVAIESLERHPENPRQGDVDAARASIERFGFYGTVVAQRSNRRILAGEHRWRAARAAGLTTVPVAWVDVDDDEGTRIMLADNRTSDLAGYDQGKLAAILGAMEQGTGLAGTGWEDIGAPAERGDTAALASTQLHQAIVIVPEAERANTVAALDVLLECYGVPDYASAILRALEAAAS